MITEGKDGIITWKIRTGVNGEKALWVMAKPNGLSSVPGSPTVDGENQFPQDVL